MSESKGLSPRHHHDQHITTTNHHDQPLPSRDDDAIVVVVWHVYIVRCADGSLYVGETSDLNRRLDKHNDASASLFTAQRRPVKLVYSEVLATRTAALQRERQVKGWTRKKKDALIAGNLVAPKKA